MKIIDLTHKITEDMTMFPGCEQPVLTPVCSVEQNGCKETKLSFYSHTGTHIDAPAHIKENGKSLDSFPVEAFVGKALVIDCRKMEEGYLVSMVDLEKYADKLDKADFLLFNFGWDKVWGRAQYLGNYPRLNQDVIDYVVCHRYKGIGSDIVGLDPISDDKLKMHNRLFECQNIINIENLKNLHLCGDDLFTFYCLPLFYENSDGAPARAIAVID